MDYSPPTEKNEQTKATKKEQPWKKTGDTKSTHSFTLVL